MLQIAIMLLSLMLLDIPLIHLRLPPPSWSTADDFIPPDLDKETGVSCAVVGPVEDRIEVRGGQQEAEVATFNVTGTVTYRDGRRDWSALIAKHTKRAKVVNAIEEREYARKKYCDPWMKKVSKAEAKATGMKKAASK